jgi:ZIP family zinc transporter
MEDELRNITSSSPPPSTPSSQLHSENNSDSESRGEHDLDLAVVSLDRDLESASSGSNSGPNTSLRPRRETLSKSLLLLVLAITVHNIPEGIALGFAFGGLKSTGEAYQLSEAIMLAVALGLQNIPEGMAVSIPLHRSGMSKMKSFLLGQFSGSVEVLGAVLGAAFALLLTSVLPYCLSFAAGAMIYVVLSDLLPQSTQTTSRVGLWGCLAGFVLMMALDTGFS